MIEDAIVRCVPLANHIIQAKAIQFSVINQNGYFLSVMGYRVLEFDNLLDAQKMADILNLNLSPIIQGYVLNYQKKISDILNA